MNERRAELTNPQRRLPDLTLPSARSAQSERVGGGPRESLVLVMTHGAGCPACTAYLREVSACTSELAEWDARVVVGVPTAAGADEELLALLEPQVRVLVDAAGALPAAVGTAVPATAVVDRWGEIHASQGAGGEHRFPPTQELVQWARYLAIRCPECEGEAL